ncbi:MAG: helix-turn-helix domain-containing protein [Planctomycetota bacterium]|nr:helix-turn-helix domain-containing protein [Planctomycetota bacterium]
MERPFPAYLADLIRERKLSIQELHQTTGISRTTIYRHLNGQTFPSRKDRAIYATATGFANVDAFDAGWRAARVPQTQGDPDGGIPVINQAPAGEIRDYHECSTDSGVGFTYIDRGHLEGENLFAVIITGSSMVPRLTDGDYVIFQPVLDNGPVTPENGDVVFVRFTGKLGEGCTIARHRLLPDGTFRFEKDNPAFAPLACTREEIVQLAVAIERRERMKKVPPARRLARGSDADLSS